MRNEQEILKDFEELGYRTIRDGCSYLLSRKDNYIIISRMLKTFSIANYMSFTMTEFKLLHELFEYWGWIND